MRTHRNDLTAEYVRSILDYNPHTGLLTWKCSPRAGWASKPAGWRSEWGIRVRIRYRNYRAARIIYLIMTGHWPPVEIDHQDRDPFNNCWINLRPATGSENCMNRGLKSTNTTGFTGVSFRKRNSQYQAYINFRGQREHLGDFHTAEEAHAARQKREKELFGDFAPPKLSQS